MIAAVVFDVGETLVDETRHWGEWADWLGVSRLSLFAVLGAVIERGEHHRRVFDLLRPGLDIAAEQRRRGPWGHIHATRAEAALADIRIDALDELAPALKGLADGR